MIYFITPTISHEVTEVEEELQIKTSLSPQDIDWLRSLEIMGVDTETNDLDPFIGTILLLILGNQEHQYVIDCQGIDCEKLLLEIINYDPLVHPELSGIKNMKNYRRLQKVTIGANMKFDFKFIKVKWNIELMKMFDVMIAEQRLLQGMDEYNIKFNKRLSVSFALDKIVQRRLGYIPNAMDKEIREEFIGVNPHIFKFKNKHIFYAAGDIKYLFDIRTVQKQEISQLNLNFLVYHIEFPLIRILGNAELVGLEINEEKWKENIQRNKELKFKTEVKLDEEVRRLRDTILPVKERKWLTGGRFDRPRVKAQELAKDNLFGDMFEEIEVNLVGKTKKKTKSKEDSPYTNYNSSPQVITIMGRLGQPVPTHIPKTKAPGEPEVPNFYVEKGKIKIDEPSDGMYRFTMNAEAIETYKAENPHSAAKEFVTKLVDFRTYVTRLGTFGEEFLRKFRNRVSKRFHTIYRQCQAVTGRLQSGDEDSGWFNSQNIPAEKDYREPFHDNGNWIITTDLSGAEAVIMIDKARDEKFYEIAIVNNDAHSPLAQAIWRAVGKIRLDKLSLKDSDFYTYITSNGHLQQSEDDFEREHTEALALSQIVISKTENKDKRTEFKNHTFGDIYGMGDKKRSKILGLTSDEAKVAGETQKKMIPKTYRMVNSNAKFAVMNGYVLLNGRTNSRMWYSEILEAWKNKSDIPNSVRHAVESSAKNSPIQGTQADMVKEIMVEIDKESDRQDIDVLYNLALLLQVHDETVYRLDKEVKLSEVLVEFIKDDGGIEMIPINDFIKRWHTQVCNRYLSFITMAADQHVGKTWTK